MDPQTMTLDQSMGLLALPRLLGTDPETNEVIEASIGRFGPYVKRGKTFQSLAPSDDVLTIDLARALALLSNGKAKSEVLELGEYEGAKIGYLIGRYGPYLKWGKKNIALPKAFKDGKTKPTFEEAMKIVQGASKK